MNEREYRRHLNVPTAKIPASAEHYSDPSRESDPHARNPIKDETRPHAASMASGHADESNKGNLIMTKEAYRIRKIQLVNAGDWNGEQAMRAWAEGNEAEYARLIRQADSLWAQAKAIKA